MILFTSNFYTNKVEHARRPSVGTISGDLCALVVTASFTRLSKAQPGKEEPSFSDLKDIEKDHFLNSVVGSPKNPNSFKEFLLNAEAVIRFMLLFIFLVFGIFKLGEAVFRFVNTVNNVEIDRNVKDVQEFDKSTGSKSSELKSVADLFGTSHPFLEGHDPDSIITIMLALSIAIQLALSIAIQLALSAQLKKLTLL